MVGAFIDRRLLRALQGRMIRDAEIEKRFFDPGGPLGSFMARADLGLLLGLYHKFMRDEMLIISYIRNRFAHYPYPLDFSAKKILDDCKKLRLPSERLHRVSVVSEDEDINVWPPPEPAEPRERFIYSAQIILAQLLDCIRDPIAPPVPIWRDGGARSPPGPRP